MSEDELPEGWTLSSFGLVGTLHCGQSPRASAVNHEGRGVTYVSGPDQWANGRLKLNKWTDEPRRTVPPGCIFITVKGAGVGTTFPGAECVIGRDIYAYQPSPPVNARFAHFALDFDIRSLIDRAAGLIPGLSRDHILGQPLPLPPLAEQKRIVAKVEELLARVNAAREHLARVPALLKRFRQAVLAAACEGRLTEDWRKTGLSEETSAGLISRIAGIRNAHGGSRSALKQPASFDSMNAPETWEIASMDSLTLAITSGSRAWSKYYRIDAQGTFIMAQNIRPLRFDHGYRLAVAPPADDPERARTAVQRGDILVTIVGANTGDVCRITEAVDQHYVCQSVAYMRPVVEDTASFLELWLNSPSHGRRQYDDWSYGEGRPHLSLDHLRETAVALPPLAEQLEIASRVEALFKLADAIEKRVAAATTRAEKLIQAILAKAFRGELVPTEAELARREGRDYESAAALLERINRARTIADEKPASRTGGAGPAGARHLA